MEKNNLTRNKCINLLRNYKSPLYVYDQNVLENRCTQMKCFKDMLEEGLEKLKVSIHYSLKANNNPAILKYVKAAGLFVDSMSPLELDICKKCNFAKEEILYVCNNIDYKEMELINKEGILICLDSISQVETWGKMFPNTNIMVRINPGTSGVGHSQKVITSGKLTKFGITEKNIEDLFNISKKYNLNIIGVHLHLGSSFLNNQIAEYICGVEEGLRIVTQYFNKVKIVDLGGGFGIPYKIEEKSLDFKKLAEELISVLKPFLEKNTNVEELKFEPGRFIVCESGILVGNVTSIKYENDTYWVGTDIGMNDIVRPSMYDAYHKVEILSNNSKIITANICGNICESGDILGKERKIIYPDVGDIVLVYDVGAYGYSMSSNYTGRARPAEVLIDKDKCKLIRKRDEISTMECNIVW